jgi:hypothetical protein
MGGNMREIRSAKYAGSPKKDAPRTFRNKYNKKWYNFHVDPP